MPKYNVGDILTVRKFENDNQCLRLVLEVKTKEYVLYILKQTTNHPITIGLVYERTLDFIDDYVSNEYELL